MSLQLMLITGSPEVAVFAAAAGVNRIFVDMEVLGKAERQGHLDTHKAAHTLRDVEAVRGALTTAELMVRINPLHDGTRDEVEAIIALGADRIMLPMFQDPDQVTAFLEMVARRVPVTLLVETPAALVRLERYMDQLGPGDEIYFGLNDLSLGMGLSFLFEPLASGILDGAMASLRARGIPFGFGGIARVGGEGELPADWILGEHVRLGSGSVILSRAFHGGARCVEDLERLDLTGEVFRLRAAEKTYRNSGASLLEENRHRLVARVHAIAERRYRNA